MHITTLPVYSKLADEADVRAAFGNRELPVQLSQHQLETYRALTDQNVDVVINTAMTGDGKSLAAYLPSLLDPERGAFGMYPTNELARDQHRQFADYKATFNSPLRFDALWGAKLGGILEENPVFERRAEVLKGLLEKHQVLLTNPDIFHLMLNYRYESGVLSTGEMPYILGANFSTFIFDEFHIFSTPQIVSAITAMLFFCATTRPSDMYRPRFLFSSATPSTVLTDMLAASGLRVRQIGGDYRSGVADGHRQVLHGAGLHLHKLGETQSAEAWLGEHIAVIEEHWRAVPDARGVVIVNSVVEARRVAQQLRKRLPHLSIGENTGLTDAERRTQAMSAQLIIGTSTIDVGVDFNISLLIFETPDAGTFLQRFGRLGRVRRGAKAFARYEAHALFSGRTPWIYETFVQTLTERGINSGDAVDRPVTLRDAVTAAFPQPTAFQRYVRRWGALQAAHVIATLEEYNVKKYQREGAYAETTKTLRTQYERTLGLKDINSALKRYRFMMKQRSEAGSTACKKMMDEVLAFRGSSPFQVGVWDDTVKPPAFLPYDAFVIAQNSNPTIQDWDNVVEAINERFASNDERKATRDTFKYGLQRDDNPLVLYVDGFRGEREQLLLQMDKFDPRTQIGVVFLLHKLSIKRPRNPQILLLNKILRRQSVIAYVTSLSPGELRRKLRLPPFFPLYRVADSYEKEYTLALGQAALLVEAESYGKLNKKDEEDAPIMC